MVADLVTSHPLTMTIILGIGLPWSICTMAWLIQRCWPTSDDSPATEQDQSKNNS